MPTSPGTQQTSTSKVLGALVVLSVFFGMVGLVVAAVHYDITESRRTTLKCIAEWDGK